MEIASKTRDAVMMKNPWGVGWKLKLVWVSAVLVIQSVASPDRAFSSDVYSLLLDNCQDKLDAWSAQQQQQQSGVMSNFSQISGLFMRGKWWRQEGGEGGGSSDVFQGSEGKFDLFSSGFIASVGGVHNVSASIFVLNRKEKPRAIISGSCLLNVDTGELCLVGCLDKSINGEGVVSSPAPDSTSSTMLPAGSPSGSNSGLFKPVFVQGKKDCSLRGVMVFLDKDGPGHLKVEGTMESIRKSSEPQWFAPIRISGKMVNNIDQAALYRQGVFIDSGLYAIEAVIIIWQIVYSIRSPSGYFVSVLAILVQMVVLGFRAARFLYLPLHLRSKKEFKYLFTSLAFFTCFLILLLMLLNFVFLTLILRKRRMAKRSNIPDRPHELRLASVCIVIYGAIGGVLWSLENFRTYLQVVWSWFLLPQVVANVFWDLRAKPLHPVYSVGVSLCRIIYIGYDSLRPTIYGYDDVNDFPQGWFWGITVTVLAFLVYCLLQQRYGGRCFLPQRWFGYEQLPKSNSQATQHESLSKPEDRMLDL